jgi:hypothetical protein
VIVLTGQLCTVLCVCISAIYTVLYYCFGGFLGYTHKTHIIRKYRTIGITGPPTPPVSPFIRGSTVRPNWLWSLPYNQNLQRHEAKLVLSWPKTLPLSVEPRLSTSCSKQPASGPYRESDGHSSKPHFPLLKKLTHPVNVPKRSLFQPFFRIHISSLPNKLHILPISYTNWSS